VKLGASKSLFCLAISGGKHIRAIETRYVKKVVQSISPAPTPNTPKSILGIATHENTQTLVVDAENIFTGTRQSGETQPGIMIDRGGNMPITLLASEIDGVYSVPGEYVNTEYDRETLPEETPSVLCAAVIENAEASETTLSVTVDQALVLSPDALVLGIATGIHDQGHTNTQSPLP